MIRTFFVDSFTSEPFKGNPAGVCLVDKMLSDEWMLNIAREIGFSETAFVKSYDGIGTYGIRFFSPKKEIPLCGHATLASAKIIFEKTETTHIRFITVENLELSIRKDKEGIIMEFPVHDTTPLPTPHSVINALGLGRVAHAAYSPNNKIILLEIADTAVLAGLKPDFNALVNSYKNINGVLVTARSSGEPYDFHYRYFWPWAGTSEDPVTGGVQTFLAKYWSERLNKKRMRAFQASARTGFMIVELSGDKVLIYGTAVILFEGNLLCN